MKQFLKATWRRLVQIIAGALLVCFAIFGLPSIAEYWMNQSDLHLQAANQLNDQAAAAWSECTRLRQTASEEVAIKKLMECQSLSQQSSDEWFRGIELKDRAERVPHWIGALLIPGVMWIIFGVRGLKSIVARMPQHIRSDT